MNNRLPNDDFLLELSEKYFLQNWTIADISKKYDISRYKILKYLDESKEKKLIEIKLNTPYSRNYELEKIFSNKFNSNVFILKEPADIANYDSDFWHFSANIIQEHIDEKKIISCAWGESVYKTIEQFSMKIQDNIIFTQFIGVMGKYQSIATAMNIVKKAANKYGGNYLTLFSPLYIFNDTTRSLLALEPAIYKTLEKARNSDMVIVGIETASAINSVSTWKEQKYILFPSIENAIGLLYGRPFDNNGEFLDKRLDKTFGLTLDEILSIPQRFCICNDKYKAKAVLAALKGNSITHLLIDEDTALKILSL